VHIFSPDGTRVGKILVPESPANLCVGGDDGKTLFITARKSLYAVTVKVTGASR
jgi:gluconolactonase